MSRPSKAAQRSRATGHAFSRRRFLAYSGLAVAGSVAATTGYIALHNEAADPAVERVRIPVPDLPDALEGYRIAVLADFHLEPFTKIETINKGVALANSLKPDLAVLLGDYVWHELDAVYTLAPALARLDARQGVFAILGNHDIWTNVTVITEALTAVGLPPLVNQGVGLPVGRETLWLAGLDDGWSGSPDLVAALTQRPSRATTVLLMHEPDLADDYSQDTGIALQLSGHSHGGQIRFPGVGALVTPYLAWKYDMGLYSVNDMWLYTNRGLGVTNLPVRFNCPPEITEITLVRA